MAKSMLKGASHEIEIGCIWYQKKDLEIMCFSAPFLHSNMSEIIRNAGE